MLKKLATAGLIVVMAFGFNATLLDNQMAESSIVEPKDKNDVT
ncbi:hypothetical protein [Geomicrobium sediminis]|uniref:Phosphatase n=1 Tax=Geomicrobium sediminis TaxID=1347788 RepID=A0ABS2PEC4_9BACL|nr:hypothetical protein [Geomicrobium sediminis]MBM7633415.1 hypothetical protein [Geomicrobium sediminis]